MTVRNAECGMRNLLVLVVSLLTVPTPASAQTSLSIYRDGRVVVRQSLPQALQRGRNVLTLKLEGLDPATLFSPDTSVAVASATVRYPSDKSDALARAVGQVEQLVITHAVQLVRLHSLQRCLHDEVATPRIVFASSSAGAGEHRMQID